MDLFLITLAVFILVILMMAIGVLFGRPRIKGSCGGLDGCDLCELKHEGKCPRRPAECDHP